MFLEPGFKSQRSGWIEVICGSMFSGKTEELIRRLKRARIANQKVEIFKPSQDTRYDDRQVVSHDENMIIAGLDMDFKGIPFGPMPYLLAVAEYITKVHAICPHCGNLATHSYRISSEESTIVLGEKDKYEPRCRTCFGMGNILTFR